MKKNNDTRSLKWQMMRYFAFFIISTILLLWLFDIVLLDSSYKMIKQRQLKSAAAKITSNLSDKDYIEKLALADDLCVLVLDGEGDRIVSVDNSPRCTIHHVDGARLEDMARTAIDSGGEYLQKGGIREDVRKYGFDRRRFSKPENMIYTRIMRSSSDFRTVFIESNISPVNATIDTLRHQMIWISLVMIVLAGLMALYYSKKIAGPIEEVTKKAKDLGEGHYVKEEFDGGYREINQLVDTLDYAAEEIEKTDSYRRELIANVSHDLRTPLTMIIGYGEMMRDYPDHIDEQNIQTIIDEANRLSRLVNDTLDYAKYESGMIEPEKTRFSITGQIRDIIKRVNVMSDFEIVFEPDEDVFVEADEMQISQVVYNLIANAINYSTDERKVYVNQSVSREAVRIEITDTGEGIEKEKLDDIWDRYYKVDRTHRRSVIGTGLGLSIVKTILERHHAEYGVESEVGKGSTFWFELSTSAD